jgi:hypothetical protein
MKKWIVQALAASLALNGPCLAAEPSGAQGMLYVKFPLGAGSADQRAPRFGLMLAARSDLSSARGAALPRVFAVETYRRKASDDPWDALEQPNWWLIGGVAAAAAIVILAERKKSDPRPDERVCLTSSPPPPGC